MNAYTKGPWYADLTAQAEHMADSLLQNPTWVAVEAEKGHVAYCHPDNVDLIAAAPDLLDALRSIVEHSQEFGGLEDAETMLVRIAEKARAAIAKAEGN